MFQFLKGGKGNKLVARGGSVAPLDKNSSANLAQSGEEFRVGIVGMGRMGITHLSIINGLEGVRVTSVADPSKPLIGMLEKYTKLAVYSAWQEMLDNEAFDAVLVCTPPSLNFEILSACADKGISVFCEKPFLMDSVKAKTLAELFREKGLIGQVGYVNRYNAVFMEAKKLIDAGVIGNVVRFKSEMYSGTVIKPDEGLGWRSSAKSGGGATYEMAAHAIDLSLYLFGIPSTSIGNSTSRVFSKSVDDIASTTLVYESGLMGNVFVNWSDSSYRKPSNIVEVFGDKGKIIADQFELKVYLDAPNSSYNLKEGWSVFSITDLFYNVPFYVRGNEFTQQLVRFVEAVRDGRTLDGSCDLSVASETLRLLEAIVRGDIGGDEIGGK
jgi:scyllo-inositol 2-dehydrogenase (NADP+)